jgi:hypothetical protein
MLLQISYEEIQKKSLKISCNNLIEFVMILYLFYLNK